ncbi:hypothetical protein TNCV_1568331 [Trichonephila clavipes]|nr:hypothetical protein TNCV_1568331 [Trichonephila clavipes]
MVQQFEEKGCQLRCRPHCSKLRVHYFVRGGFVGYRSRASSKHLSSHLPVDGARFLGVKRGCVAPADARVSVGSTKKAD